MNPASARDEALTLVHDLRPFLTLGRVTPPDPEADAVRRRAFDLEGQLLRGSREALRRLERAHEGSTSSVWTTQDQETARAVYRLLDAIGHELYFASGAYRDTQPDTGNEGRRLSVQEKQRFLAEAGPLIDELADIGMSSIAHHLLQLLEAYVPLDPSGVFRRVGRIVLAGEAGGYQYESLAVDLIVRLVERYLAAYRAVLRESDECRQTLLAVLEVFVRAGWPAARRLVYRLDEIYR